MAKPTAPNKSPESQHRPLSPQPSPAPKLSSYGLRYLGEGFFALFRVDTQGSQVVGQKVLKTNIDRATALALLVDEATLEDWGRAEFHAAKLAEKKTAEARAKEQA
jgi:hypothetical protein